MFYYYLHGVAGVHRGARVVDYGEPALRALAIKFHRVTSSGSAPIPRDLGTFDCGDAFSRFHAVLVKAYWDAPAGRPRGGGGGPTASALLEPFDAASSEGDYFDLTFELERRENEDHHAGDVASRSELGVVHMRLFYLPEADGVDYRDELENPANDDDTGDSDDDNARPLWGGVTRDPILCCWLGRTMPNESAPLLPFMEEAVKSTETLTEVFGSGDKDMAARAARRVVGVMWLDGSAKVTTQKHNLSFDLKDIYARSRFSYHKACGASTRRAADVKKLYTKWLRHCHLKYDTSASVRGAMPIPRDANHRVSKGLARPQYCKHYRHESNAQPTVFSVDDFVLVDRTKLPREKGARSGGEFLAQIVSIAVERQNDVADDEWNFLALSGHTFGRWQQRQQAWPRWIWGTLCLALKVQ